MLSRRVRTAVETRWRAATVGAAEPVGDALVVEVVDEAQPQRGLRAVSVSGAISASKAPSS